MDLSTKYMGLNLRNPLVISASPLTDNIENIRKADEYGIGAVVLKSLFEEQIREELDTKLNREDMFFWYPEAAEHIRKISDKESIRPYLNLVQAAKKETSLPVIASINCYSAGGWTSFAQKIREAGADALELNIATHLPGEEDMYDCGLEENITDIVKKVKEEVEIPIAIKIGPCFCNLIRTGKKIEAAGADALVLFNRFYQPDIDIDTFEVISDQNMSAPEEMAQSLRWVGILSRHVSMDLAASTGIHSYQGVVKQLLAGAAVTQICTTLYKRGLQYIPWMLEDLESWMKDKGFAAIDEFRGRISDDRLKSVKFEQIQFIEKNLHVH